MTAIPRKHIKGLQIYSMFRAWSRLAQPRDHFLISGNIDNDNLFCYSGSSQETHETSLGPHCQSSPDLSTLSIGTTITPRHDS